MFRRAASLLAPLVFVGIAACAEGAGPEGGAASLVSAGRDWAAHPAVLRAPLPPVLYAVSDIHGGYERVAALLAANGVLAGVPAAPAQARWAGGAATLVVVGDLIDKGPQPIEVLDFLIALEADAARAGEGGRVVALLGNHEAEFFADPENSKATGAGGVDLELGQRGIRPGDLASGADPRGAWLRDRPLAFVSGGWFFAHAGDSGGLGVAALEQRLEAAIDAHPDFDDPDVVGASSILESRSWWQQHGALDRNLAALGATHIVFGHDPGALGSRGAIAVDPTARLLRIDCGLSPLVNDSSGKLLRLRQTGSDVVADELDASGAVRPLLR